MFTKAPFLRLLISLIGGIILQYYLSVDKWIVLLLFLGLTVMLFSFFVSPQKRYSLRWLFGLGASFFMLAIGGLSTSVQQKSISFNFPDSIVTYRAIIVDVPQQKPHLIALKLKLPDWDKKILCNLQSSVLSKRLKCGDEIMFRAQIEPFANLGNPDEFDYAAYMHNNGFAGTAYLSASKWDTTGKTYSSLNVIALECQQKIVKFYKSLNLTNDEFALLSALTIGYKDSLSNNLKQGFRATGVAHVMAVSGLHVGVIFLVISALFKLVKDNRTYFVFSQVLIILLLWMYAFVTGLSPSVIRASILLTLFCVSRLVGRKVFLLNSIAFAAFIMLLINPLLLFNISFQFSFVAVFSILFLQPYNTRIEPRNRVLKYIWIIFSISCIVQLGTFPLALYYFGTFPSYFFMTNVLVVPLVGFIIYIALVLLALTPLVAAFPSASHLFYFLPIHLLHYVISAMTHVVDFFQKLPFAYFQDLKISFLTLVLSFLGLIFMLFAVVRQKVLPLKLALCTILVFILVHLPSKLDRKNKLIIFNRPKAIDIEWNIGPSMFKLDSVGSYKFISLQDKRLLVLKAYTWQIEDRPKFTLDYLYLLGNKNASLSLLSNVFVIKNVVLNGSMSPKRRAKILQESRALHIPCYDIKKNGALIVDF